jgi:hypothetical protein
MAQWFTDGGSYMLGVLALDALGLLALAVSWIVALTGRVRGRTGLMVKGVPALVMLGSFSPVLVGAAGWYQGRSLAIEAASLAAPAARAATLSAGLELALIPLRFGGMSTVVLGSLAVLALAIAPWAGRER